ncbi:uncharacterized protein LOC129757417 isoform X2 [Uranotaenia lowii]|uniref:uncharacterized protein LOC129757417 isoform X2 n=1 Tax=Uranotaenia lowii TaxID=190385 RepID=UPI00247AC5E3|nr:uncharacterized protein LOC129757417 isoform X2 [Uranotaenia lowii]
MKRSKLILIVVQRVLITLTMFLAAIVLIYYTAVTPQELFSPCNRTCNRADWPRICRYRLVIERKLFLPVADHKNIMNFDETSSSSNRRSRFEEQYYFLVNGEPIGPVLKVCKNDFIMVDVENRVQGSNLALHWTGQSQRMTPFMDGVPIFTTFQYKFRADRVGTHLYYGFGQGERLAGLVGALIVQSSFEQKQHPPTRVCQRPENDIVWIISIYAGRFLLINGHRQLVQVVRPGQAYRFRMAFVAAADSCGLWLEIQGHRMTIVALDGHLVEPLTVDRISLSDGDRIDFILYAAERRTIMQDYEIRFVTGTTTTENGTCSSSVAVAKHNFRLRYAGNRTAGDEADWTEQPSALAAGEDDALFADGPVSVTTPKDSPKDELIEQPPYHIHSGSRSGFQRTIFSSRLLLSDTEDTTFETSAQADDRQWKQLGLLDVRAIYTDNGKAAPERIHFPGTLREGVDRRISLVLSGQKVRRIVFGESCEEFIYSVNGLSFAFPPVLMLPSGSSNRRELNQFTCSNSSGQDGDGGGPREENGGDAEPNQSWVPKSCHPPDDKPCECVHIENIETGHRVELVLINADSGSDHTYHLHGLSFYVLGTTSFADNWQDALRSVKRNFVFPLLRDTIRIPSRSLVVLRFIASNAGLWMLRDLGATAGGSTDGWTRGLDVLLNVGSERASFDIPDDFPTCRSFVGPKYFLI